MRRLLWWRCGPVGLEERRAIAQAGFDTSIVQDPDQAQGLLQRNGYHAILVSCPDRNTPLKIFSQRLQESHDPLPVLIYDPRDGDLPAVCTFWGKPPAVIRGGPGALQAALGSLLQSGAATSADPKWRSLLVGSSAAMQKVFETIRLVAPCSATVLITGETGTGKELVAKAIHAASKRSSGPMVTVNCSAIPEALLEAELFGHRRGAFTGAVSDRMGQLEQANGGTVLLDEVGEMPLDLQPKLLRALQEREIQPVGSASPKLLDIRVLAATNRSLEEAVRQGSFRRDLFYRLNVVPLVVPPLRQRLSDLPELVAHFTEKVCRRDALPPCKAGRGVLDLLSGYSWPGNVRELEHRVERAVILSNGRGTLIPEDFLPLHDEPVDAGKLVAHAELPAEGIDFEEMMTSIQRSILAQALARAGGNKAKAAGLLRMKRSTLLSKVKAIGA